MAGPQLKTKNSPKHLPLQQRIIERMVLRQMQLRVRPLHLPQFLAGRIRINALRPQQSRQIHRHVVYLFRYKKRPSENLTEQHPVPGQHISPYLHALRPAPLRKPTAQRPRDAERITLHQHRRTLVRKARPRKPVPAQQRQHMFPHPGRSLLRIIIRELPVKQGIPLPHQSDGNQLGRLPQVRKLRVQKYSHGLKVRSGGMRGKGGNRSQCFLEQLKKTTQKGGSERSKKSLNKKFLKKSRISFNVSFIFLHLKTLQKHMNSAPKLLPTNARRDCGITCSDSTTNTIK